MTLREGQQEAASLREPPDTMDPLSECTVTGVLTQGFSHYPPWSLKCYVGGLALWVMGEECMMVL